MSKPIPRRLASLLAGDEAPRFGGRGVSASATRARSSRFALLRVVLALSVAIGVPASAPGQASKPAPAERQAPAVSQAAKPAAPDRAALDRAAPDRAALDQAAPDRAAVIKVAAGIMQRARFCALVTLGLDGHPQSRIVDAFEPDANMVVWIATTPVTRKVAEIRKDPRVTLSYFDLNSMGYVTLIGRAAFVTAAAEKAKRWKEDWATIYKDKNRGDDYLLIKVTPVRLEVSAEGEGVKNDPKTWKPVIVEFK